MPQPRILSIIKIAITLAILVFSVYFSIRNVEFSKLGASFQSANYLIPLALIPIVFSSFVVRALRWKAIIRHMYPEVGLGALTAGVVVGYFMNNIIPRSGELARPYFTAQREASTKFTGLLGTIVVERFLDVIFLLLFIASVLAFDSKLFAGFESHGITTENLMRTLYPMIILGVLILFIAPTRLGYRIAELCTRVLPERFRERVLAALQQLLQGFGAIRTFRQIAMIVGYSLLLYLIYIIPVYVMFFAFPAETGVTATMFDAIKVFTITSIAFAVAPTPGGFGVFHVTAQISVMKILNFSDADALAYATITHFLSYAITMVAGAYYLIAGNVSFKDLMGKREEN